jgi:hypothetical protein
VLLHHRRQLPKERHLLGGRQHAPAQQEHHVDLEHPLHRLGQLVGRLLPDDERAHVAIAANDRRRRHAIKLAALRPGVVTAIAAQRIGHQRIALDPVLVDALVEPGARDHATVGVGGHHQVHLHLVVEVLEPLLHRAMDQRQVGRSLGRLLQRLHQHRVRRHLRRRVDPLARVDLEQQRRRMLRALEPRPGLALEVALERPRRQQRYRHRQRTRDRDQEKPRLRPEHQGLAPIAVAGTWMVTSVVRDPTSTAWLRTQRSR